MSISSLVSENYPNITWCPCIKVSARFELVKETLSLVEKVHPKREEPLTVMSIGSGGCLQELHTMSALADRGYRKFRMILIDPSDYAKRASDDLKNYYSKHLKDKSPEVEILFLRSLDHFMEQRPIAKIDVALLIDLQKIKLARLGQTVLGHTLKELAKHRVIQEGSIVAYTWEERARFEQGALLQPFQSGARIYRYEEGKDLKDLRDLREIQSIYTI